MFQVNRIIENLKIWFLDWKKTIIVTLGWDSIIAKWKNILTVGNERLIWVQCQTQWAWFEYENSYGRKNEWTA